MPQYVVKADPDKDVYVGWSTIVDGPTWVGDREYAVKEMEIDLERLERADRYGTSSHDRFYGWDEATFICVYDMPDFRSLPRANLVAFAEALIAGRTDEAVALTEPIDD